MYIPPMDIHKKITIEQIYESAIGLNLRITHYKQASVSINSFASIYETKPESVSFLNNSSDLYQNFSDLNGLIIIDSKAVSSLILEQIRCSYLVVDHAKYLFCYIYKHFFLENDTHQTLKPWKNSDAVINDNCVLEEGVLLADDVIMGANCHIYPNVILHSGVRLGSNVIIKSNTTIGGAGFGYAIRKGYPPLEMPHVGGVVIGDNVSIGSATQIDRGTFANTCISNDVKIDNLVHIAHNVRIGSRTLVAATSEISGSVEIGCDSWISPGVRIKEKVKIGDQVLVGIGSVVIKNVPDAVVTVGVPARFLRENN
jgi:UDP-3-O-[3-hydroxymyristoyl] glucosamine N-acyltransferase